MDSKNKYIRKPTALKALTHILRQHNSRNYSPITKNYNQKQGAEKGKNEN